MLPDALGVTRPRSTALRTHLGIDNDPRLCHTFTFSKQKHVRFSDQALVKMKAAKDVPNVSVIWDVHSPNKIGNAARINCGRPDCACGEQPAAKAA